MSADLVTQPVNVRLEGGYVFVTLKSGPSESVFVLTQEAARSLASDIETALDGLHDSVTPLPERD